MGSAPRKADVKPSFSKSNRKNMVVHVHGRELCERIPASLAREECGRMALSFG